MFNNQELKIRLRKSIRFSSLRESVLVVSHTSTQTRYLGVSMSPQLHMHAACSLPSLIMTFSLSFLLLSLLYSSVDMNVFHVTRIINYSQLTTTNNLAQRYTPTEHIGYSYVKIGFFFVIKLPSICLSCLKQMSCMKI